MDALVTLVSSSFSLLGPLLQFLPSEKQQVLEITIVHSEPNIALISEACSSTVGFG